MRRRVAWFAVVLLGAGPLAAQDGTDLNGSRVRVKTTLSGVIVGSVTGVDPDALTIRTESGDAVQRVAWADVATLDVSRGFRRRTGEGLLAGAATWGVIVGLYAVFDTLDESGVGEPAFIGVLLGSGAVVGTLLKTERWKRLPGVAVSMQVSARHRGLQAGVMVAF